ncbi:U3 small nucleolar RNA-associated protein [Chloropicon primus]|uniref:U3 small nucleolar RNA-associated protein n=5 Tax=Chloropicon primus TaxID=1764295 RepID=A0A5B8N0S5_9CHLO|nr:U3 small nucleolar RNA-associated protein [Chloropicon primus]UPR04712.1 U3 small nucleolar RNA-associated protein [Chloropicon primus]|eukprot:QDZ25515.1 U3 small nucleolar RNA-associated protein [Chloropicon primus]
MARKEQWSDEEEEDQHEGEVVIGPENDPSTSGRIQGTNTTFKKDGVGVGMASSSSKNRFKFLNFKESLAKVDIDVYRSVKKVNANPKTGDNFLHDALQEYRELCLHKAFLDVHSKVFPLCQSIAQVVYHKQLIFDTIADELVMESKMSMEALMYLLANMARDLQDDFMPFVPPLISAVDSLLACGGSQDAGVIEHVFTGLFQICKFLVKDLIEGIEGFSRSALALLFNRQSHIRKFAAEMMSFVFRNADLQGVRSGVLVLVNDKSSGTEVARGTKLEAISLLIANSLLSTREHLHSKAESVFELLFALSFTSSSDGEDQFCKDSLASVSLLSLHKLYQINKRVDLVMPLRVLSRHNPVLGQGAKLDSGGANVIAWYLKVANMLLGKVKGEACSELIAETYSDVLSHVSGSKKVSNLQVFQRSGRDCGGAETLGDQAQYTCEGEVELRVPGVLPELFLFMFDCAFFLQSTGTESHASALKLSTRLMHRWNSHLSLSSVKTFCDIVTVRLKGRPQLIESLAPMAFLIIKETLQGDSLIRVNAGSEGMQNCVDILLRAYNLHTVSGNVVDVKISKEISSLLLNTAQELIDLEMHHGGGGDLGGGMQAAFFPVHYLVLRLIQKINIAKHRFEAGNLIHRYAREVKAEGEDTFTLVSEAVKTAVVDLPSYTKMKDAFFEMFSSVGRHLVEIPVLKNLIWVLDLPFLPEEERQELCRAMSTDSCEQIIGNLSGRNKQVRLKTLELLAKGAFFCYGGEFYEDSDHVFDDILSIVEMKFTLSTSRAISNKIKRYALDIEYQKLDNRYVGILAHVFVGYLNDAFSECWEPCVGVLKELLSKHFSATFGTVWAHLMGCHKKIVFSDDTAGAPEPEVVETAYGLDLLDEPRSDKGQLTLIPILYKLLVSCLKSNHQMWAKESEKIVPAFMGFSDTICKGLVGVSGQHGNDILFEWIGIMESIPSIHKAEVGPALKVRLEALLSKVSPQIQVQVLRTLKSWKVPVLSSRADILIQACNLKTEKDLLPFQRQHNVEKGLSEEERVTLVPLLLRILFPKMKRKKMRLTSRRSQGTARKSILHFLSCFDTVELELLHELFIDPILSFGGKRSKFSFAELADSKASSKFIKSWNSEHIPLNVQVGFLDAFKDFLGCLGKHMADYLFPWMSITLCFLQTICANGEIEATQHDPTTIISMCLDILTDILKNYEVEEFSFVLTFVEEALLTMSKTKHFQSYQVFHSSVLYLRSILSSETWGQQALGHRRVEVFLDCLFGPLQDMSPQKKKSVLSFVESILEEAPKSSAMALEKYYPCLLVEVKSMDFKAGNRRDMVFTLNIVQKMSDLFSENADTFETLHVLVGSLKWFHNKRTVSKNEVLLRSILRVISTLGSSFVEKVHAGSVLPFDFEGDLPPLVDLFLYVRQNDIRLDLCSILDTVLTGISIMSNKSFRTSLDAFVGLCKDLNSLSGSMIGEIDYDKRLGAYSQIQTMDWSGLASARSFVQKILLYQCVFDLTEVEDFSMQQASSETLKKFISDCKGNPDVFDLEYRDTVYRLLKGGIHNKKESVRKEYLHLISHLFLEFPDCYQGMTILCDEDPEQDFFKNVTHLQLHRRVRAVNKLVTLMEKGSLSTDGIVDIVVPVLMGFICDDKGASVGGTMSNLVDKCIDSLGEACRHIEWNTLKGVLSRFLRILKSKSALSKSIMRAVSSSMTFFENRDDMVVSDQVSGEQQFPEPLQYIYKVVLPYLSLLFYQDRDPPSYLVAVLAQVLKVMPENLTRIEIPQLIQRLSSRLKNDLQSSRVNTREAICAMLDVTGYQYLSYVINSVDSTLLNRGVQGYIKGYSVYFILKNIENKLAHGEIDEHLDALFDIFQVDIFGDVARDRQERKESEKLFSKTFKEGQRCFSLDAFELIVSLMNIEDSLLSMVEFVDSNFNAEKKRVRLTARLFDCMAQGIMSNEHLSQKYLLVFFYGIIEDHNESLASQEKKMESFQKISSISTSKLLEEEEDMQDASDFLLLEVKAGFALTVLWKFIKNGKLNEGMQKEEYMQLLDPWTSLLAPVLKSRKSSLVVLALKCLNRIYTMPLQSNGKHASVISKEVFSILKRSSKLTDGSAQECLKLLTIFLKHYTKYSPTQTQLSFLIKLISPDIEKTENQNGMFAFLKAIISRGLVLPSVYDLMEKVSTVVLSSGSDSTRRTAGQVFLMFLLDYPMNDNRRKHHLEFVIKNCDFKHEAGRLSMLELILSVIRKFPADIIQDLGEMFLFPLVLRVCNEESAKCKAFAGDALETLLSRSREDFKKNAYKLSLGWVQNQRVPMKAAGCQLAFFLNKSGCLSSSQLRNKLLVTLTEELNASLTEANNATTKYLESALTALDALLKHKTKEKDTIGCHVKILDISESLLLVPYAAIKILGAKVLQSVLENASKRMFSELDRFQRLFRVVVDQLQDEITAEFGEQVNSLVAILLREFDVNSIVASEEEGDVGKSTDLPLRQCVSLASGAPLSDYFFALKRITSLAAGNTTHGRPATSVQQRTALLVLSSFVEGLDLERLGAYLVTFMIPIYTINESSKSVDVEIKEVSDGMVEKLDARVGNDAVASTYNKARAFVVRKRKDRKQNKAVLKLVDPEQAAKDKVVRNLKRKVSRKRQKDKGVFKKKRRHNYARE